MSLIITNMDSKNSEFATDPVGDIQMYIKKLVQDEITFDTKVQEVRSSLNGKFDE